MRPPGRKHSTITVLRFRGLAEGFHIQRLCAPLPKSSEDSHLPIKTVTSTGSQGCTVNKCVILHNHGELLIAREHSTPDGSKDIF